MAVPACRSVSTEIASPARNVKMLPVARPGALPQCRPHTAKDKNTKKSSRMHFSHRPTRRAERNRPGGTTCTLLLDRPRRSSRDTICARAYSPSKTPPVGLWLLTIVCLACVCVCVRVCAHMCLSWNDDTASRVCPQGCPAAFALLAHTDTLVK